MKDKSNKNRFPTVTIHTFYYPQIVVFLTLFFIPYFWLPRAASAESGFYTIQLGAYKNKSNAQEKVSRLKKVGINAFISQAIIERKEKLYRVDLEKYSSKREAEKEAKTLKKAGLISKYFIRALGEISQTGQGDRAQKDYYLHISSFKDKRNAEREVRKLGKQGHKFFIETKEVQGERWFKVYGGAFKDEQEARKFGSELKKKGIISYFKPIKSDQADTAKLQSTIKEKALRGSEKQKVSQSRDSKDRKKITTTSQSKTKQPATGNKMEKVPLTTFSAPKQGVVHTAKVNLRSGPGSKEKIVGMILMKNTSVEVLGRKGEWFKVKIGNGEFWIHKDYLTLDQEET
jgi:cell division septation protein DedD